MEKKATVVAVLVALTLVGAPLAASAAPTVSVKTIGGTTFHTEDTEDSSTDGDQDKDDDHHGSIPPVFVVPGHKKPHHDRGQNPPVTPAPDATATPNPDPTGDGSATTSSIDPVTGQQDFMVVGAGGDPATDSLGGVNPEEARAVDIRRVPDGMRTPADQFMDTAYIGMGMLGLAALGLGGTAVVRAIRLRKSGKSDYIYSDK